MLPAIATPVRRRASLLIVTAALAVFAVGCYSPTGTLDVAVDASATAGGIRVAGWAFDLDQPAPIPIHVYVDGQPAAATVADRPRPDVAALVPGAHRNTGYDVTVPAGGGVHQVCVYGIDIAGGDPPALLACRTVSVGPGAFPPDVSRGVSYGPDPAHRADVYRPASAATDLPVILWLHSGGWISGDRLGTYGPIQQRVHRGQAVVVSIDYRLAPAAPFPAALQDAKRAVRWVKANATALGIDPGRVVVAGASSGANLAAMVGATTAGHFDPPDLPPDLAAQDNTVAAVVDLVGPSDFTTFWRAGTWAADMQWQYLGCGGPCPPALSRHASVLPWLDGNAPPAFLGYGALDTLVVAGTQGAPLAARWSEVRGGRDVTYVVYPGQGHNLDLDVDVTFHRFLDRFLSGPV